MFDCIKLHTTFISKILSDMTLYEEIELNTEIEWWSMPRPENVLQIIIIIITTMRLEVCSAL